MKRIIVCGASGFLGHNLVNEAKNRGIPVLAITTKPETIQYEGVYCTNTQGFLAGNVELSNADVFINCVFPTNADGIKMADGLKTTYEVIIAAKESGVGAFVNISSQSVYPSKREEAANENTHLSLETPYAVGKYSTEVFTNTVFERLPHTNIRLASLIGVGYDQRIINRMILQGLKGEVLKVIGGMQRYGFLDVRDAASGLIALSQSNVDSWKQEYNLGRAECYTLIDVVNVIVDELRNCGLTAEYEVSEGTDTRNSALDPYLFCTDINWEPKISLEQTVKDIIVSKLCGN